MPNTTDKELDEVYAAMDALMLAGCWGFLDEYLHGMIMRSWRTDLDILLAIATATLPGKSKLPARVNFLDNDKRLHPNKELWKGLD